MKQLLLEMQPRSRKLLKNFAHLLRGIVQIRFLDSAAQMLGLVLNVLP